jgi:tetratricopeptide (TPR) repeat protein
MTVAKEPFNAVDSVDHELSSQSNSNATKRKADDNSSSDSQTSSELKQTAECVEEIIAPNSKKINSFDQLKKSLNQTRSNLQAIFAPTVVLKDENLKEMTKCISAANQAFERLEFGLAVEHYERVHLLISTIEDVESATLSYCLRQLVDAYTFLDEPLKALEAMRNLRRVEKFSAPEPYDLTILTRAANALENKNLFSESEAIYKEAFNLAHELLPANDPLIRRLSNSCIGMQDSANRSIDSSQQTLPSEAVKEEELKQELELSLQSGDAAINSIDFDLACTHYERALLLLSQLPIYGGEQTRHCLHNLSDAYIFLGKPEKALSMLDQLWKFESNSAVSIETVKILAKRAATCRAARFYGEAESTYREALMLACQILPPSDPLITSLNSAYIDLHKRSAPELIIKHSEQQTLLKKIQAGESIVRRQSPQKPGLKPEVSVSRFSFRARLNSDNQRWRLVLRSPWFLSFLTLLLVAGYGQCYLAFYKAIASKQTMPANFTGKWFASCDRKKTITFLSKEQCVISEFGRTTKARYVLLAGDHWSPSNFWSQNPEVWYRFDATGLVGQDQVSLYASTAPEMAIVKKMWWYADFARQYYKGCRVYPSDSEKCKQSDSNFGYTNPFTGQPDYAAIILQKQKDRDVDLTERKNNNRHWRPGAISCVCIDYKKFLVQGFDRDGKLLTSSDPAHYFTIDCQNGINLTKADQPQAHPDLEPETTVVLYETPELEATMKRTRQLFQILLWVALCTPLLGFWIYLKRAQTSQSTLRGI